MAESSITRGIAVDPRVKNSEAVEMHVNAGLFLREDVRHVLNDPECDRHTVWLARLK